jgi:hypothetical protein
VLLTQLYFAASEEHAFAFVCSLPDRVRTDSVVSRTRSSTEQGVIANVVRAKPGDPATEPRLATVHVCETAPPTWISRKTGKVPTHTEVLQVRARALAAPLGALFAVSVALTLLWMLSGQTGTSLTFLGVVALLTGGGLLIRAFVVAQAGSAPGFWHGFLDDTTTQLWFGAAAFGIVAAVLYTWYGRRSLPDPMPADRMRNRIVHFHSMVNVSLALGAAALIIGGFGHEIAWWFTDEDRGLIAQAGGWSAILVSVGTAAYTSMRAAPSPKDERTTQRPNVVSRLVFAIAPVLVLVVLAVLLAWLGNQLMAFGSAPDFAAAIAVVVVVGVLLELMLAMTELWLRLRDSVERQAKLNWFLLGGIVASAVAVVFVSRMPYQRVVSLSAIGLTLALLAFRALTTRESLRGAGGQPLRVRGTAESGWDLTDEEKKKANRTRRARLTGVASLVTVASGFLTAASLWVLSRPRAGDPGLDLTSMFALGAIVFIIILVFIELALVDGDSERAIGLSIVAAVSCAILIVLHFADASLPQTAFARAGYGLVASALALVIALGWAIDPNLISLHTFYRARLVRAYLGASNANRVTHDITESAPHDDIPLSLVRNYERGGPYHLINTTLNLAGGRDLATAQRSAENFVLSSLHCGSGRTGYRATKEYMSDSMTLGAAVAISGAAVSPNMGSATPSAALAMLLALFNVRIGFWAPTPDRRRFYERAPRLWPVYLLRESLSQTNDLGTYCYLTDGGHFDNSALYALIERGCKTIVVVDDGADPTPCFGDMGQAVRRCRIDFGTEFKLLVDEYLPLPAKDGGDDKRAHVVKGEIYYSRDHLEQLGYPRDVSDATRTGSIYWIKPVVRTADTVDVRQYKRQNDDFPQQTTADQWFDEAQFESYRKLGMLSGVAAAELIDPTTRSPNG